MRRRRAVAGAGQLPHSGDLPSSRRRPYVGAVSSTSDLSDWDALRAWSRSLRVQVAVIPVIAYAGFRATRSGLAALTIGVAALLLLVIRRRVRAWRRRRREAREHIAGLSDY
jgi:hypothetical protein